MRFGIRRRRPSFPEAPGPALEGRVSAFPGLE